MDVKIGEIKKYSVSVNLILEIDYQYDILDISSEAAKNLCLRSLVNYINNNQVDAELLNTPRNSLFSTISIKKRRPNNGNDGYGTQNERLC